MSIQNFHFRLPSIPKLICSIPVLLVTLYFVPPLGVILTIARLFIYGTYNYYRVPMALLICALLFLAPRAYELLQQNIDGIPVFQPFIDFRGHALYPKFTDFGRFVSIFSIIMIIATFALKKVINAFSQAIRLAQVASREQKPSNNQTKIMQKEGAKTDPSDQSTPHVVKCPSCGKVNSITGTVGKCKSCRNPIEWHSSKK